MYPEKPKRCSPPLDNKGDHHFPGGDRWTRGRASPCAYYPALFYSGERFVESDSPASATYVGIIEGPAPPLNPRSLFYMLKMVQIAHAIRALAFVSFRYIVGAASLCRVRFPVMKPVATFFGEPGLPRTFLFLISFPARGAQSRPVTGFTASTDGGNLRRSSYFRGLGVFRPSSPSPGPHAFANSLGPISGASGGAGPGLLG